MFFFKQKTAYEMRISDWSSDVCSSDLVFDGTEFERGHRQNHAGEIGTADFRIRERRPRGKVIFGIEAYANAGTKAAAEAGTLVCRSLRARLDLQLLHAGARRTPVKAHNSGVDDVATARHRHPGLGHRGHPHGTP